MIYLLAFLMNVTNGLQILCNPLLALSFGADSLALGYLGSAPSLVYALGCVASGFWVSRFGYKRVMALACALLVPVFASILLVERFRHLLLLAVFASVCTSLFWPAMIRWVGTERRGDRLRVRVGNYNIAMIGGVMAGPLLGGVIFPWDYRYPYLFSAATVFAILLLLAAGKVRSLRRAALPGPPGREEPGEQGASPGFVYASWTANFCAWFAIGASQALFPKLALSLDSPIGDRFLGVLFALVAGGEIAVFLILRRSSRWHYHYPCLLGFQLLGIGGLLILALNSSHWLFMAGFLGIGFAGGMTYFSSMFYSVHRPDGGGGRGGFHESFLGFGVALGPLAGGLAARAGGLRAPYYLAAGVFLFGILLQCFFLRRVRRLRTTD